MLQPTRKFIEKEMLFHGGSNLLVGVSGGVDSMVLADVLRRLGYSVAIAHVNYRLRKEDSENDARLVESYARDHGLPVHVHTVGPAEARLLTAGNLQDTARNIRMQFFEGLIADYGYDLVCLGHHLDDVAETFLLHALRASGIRGLRSIQPKSGFLRRPLLWATKEIIHEFAVNENIPFREDQTNLGDLYDRNYLRHHIFPVLERRFEQARKRMATSATRLGDEYQAFQYLLEVEKNKWCTDRPDGMDIHRFKEVAALPGAASILHYWLQPYGFKSDVIFNMLNAELSGSRYFADHYEAVYDRDVLLIRLKQVADNRVIDIPEPGQYYLSSTERISLTPSERAIFSADAAIEYVDMDSISFPLKIRRWQEGDRFKPFGLDGQSKKVSDFFADRKMSLFDKDKAWLLCDDSDILWIVGYQLAYKARVTPETKSYLRLDWSASGPGSMQSS